MASHHTQIHIMEIITATFVAFCLNHCILNKNVFAELEVQPLGNTSYHSWQACNTSKTESETLQIHGSITEMCNLQLESTSQSTTLSVLLTDIVDDFVIYIERLGDLLHCQNKYLILKGTNQPCEITFVHSELEVWIHGSVNVLVTEMSTTDHFQSLPCPESDLGTSKVSQIPDCDNIKGYNHISTCQPRNDYVYWDSSFTDDPVVCSLDFPENCTANLGDREVFIQYSNKFSQENQNWAIMYPSNINALDLTFNSIVNIQPNAFQGLDNVRVLNMTNNALVSLDVGVFHNMKNLNYIDLTYTQLEIIHVKVFQGLPSLVYLDIDYNELITVQVGLFDRLFNLMHLDLQFNKLVVLDAYLFKDLYNLTYIDLDNNQLAAVHPEVFKGLYQLEYLHLDYNQLTSLDAGLFSDLYNLIYLDLKVNRFVSLQPTLLQNLHNLKTLLLGENQLNKLDRDLFQGTKNLQFLDLSENRLNVIPNIRNLNHLSYFRLNDNPLIMVDNQSFVGIPITVEFYVSQPEICTCYTPAKLNCTAARAQSPFLTCHRLLDDKVLQVFMWLIGINAIGGNIFVMCWQTKNSKRRNKIQSLLLSNLAVSDLLMGIYMLVIASADIYFGEHFPMQAEIWRRSTNCRIVGTIAILAGEASVFFVTMISVDRLMDIKFPMASKNLKKKITSISIGIVWIISLTLGIIPSFLAGKNLDFYDNSHVCIGLPLALLEKFSIKEYKTEICPANTPFCHTKTTTQSISHGFDSGLYFSTAMFLGLNCLCYLIILACYIEIIRSVYKSSKRANLNREMKEQIKLTMKVAAIVATDFLCWFPIIILGILVQAKVLTLPTSVFAWSVTVILPINSAINPYLYTVTVIISKRRKQNDASQTEQSMTRTQAFILSQGKNRVHPERTMDTQMGPPAPS